MLFGNFKIINIYVIYLVYSPVFKSTRLPTNKVLLISVEMPTNDIQMIPMIPLAGNKM